MVKLCTDKGGKESPMPPMASLATTDPKHRTLNVSIGTLPSKKIF